METVEGVLRGLSYAGLVLVVGTTVYWYYVVSDGFGVRSVRRLVAGGLALTGATAVGELIIVAVHAHSNAAETIATRTGTALTLRLALTALLAAWAWQVSERELQLVPVPSPVRVPVSAVQARTVVPADASTGFGGVLTAGLAWSDEPAAPPPTEKRPNRVGAAALGLLLVLFSATWVLPSRSVVGHYPGVKAPLDLVHVVAVTLWLGGLLSVLIAVSNAVDAERLVDLLPRVTVISAAALLALVVTGVGQALAEADGAWPAAGTPFGQLALAKTALFVVAAMVAAVARSFAARRLGDLAVGMTAPRTAVTVLVTAELGLGAATLGLAAALTLAAY